MAAIFPRRDQAQRAELTRHCHACDRRRPASGFRLLAGRQVGICKICWPKFRPFYEALCGPHAIRLLIATIRLRDDVGGLRPSPGQLAETVARFTAK